MNTRHIATIALVVTIITTAGAIIVSRLSAQTSPAVSCSDSDGGYNYTVKGTATGIYGGAVDGYHAIYGQEPNPLSPKQTTENYSTFIDHCATDRQLNEGFCDASTGKMSAFGYQCPYGCGDGVCLSSPDTPPTITLGAQATMPTTWRPGGQGTFSWSVTDDQSLQSVIITSSLMNYQRITINNTGNCSGKTSCEWTEYAYVPSSPGPQFVTVTATDSAGQVSTKTVNFDAVACTTDTDCGSGVQWTGAAFCGSGAGGDRETDVMQNGVAATCASGGICDTSSKRLVKQWCGAGRVCTFDNRQSDGAVCVVEQPECALGMRITSLCKCGNATLNYPLDYRTTPTPAYCCSSANGGTALQSSPCVSASTCTLTLGGNKSAYVIGEEASFSVMCATPSFVTMHLVDSSGKISFIGQMSDVRTSNVMGFSTERYAIGNHSLRICVNDETCQPASIVTAPFTVMAKTASPVPSIPTTATSALLPAVNPMPSGFLAAPVMTHPSAPSTQTAEKKSPVITPKTTVGDRVPNIAVEGNRLNAARREMQLLENRGKQTSAKIKSIGKGIASFEKKIDAKLRLLDRSKRKEVQKRVTAQIEQLEEKVASLEEKKEKLEQDLEEFRARWEEWRVMME